MTTGLFAAPPASPASLPSVGGGSAAGVENSPHTAMRADITESLIEWLEILYRLFGGIPGVFDDPQLTLEMGMSYVEQQYLECGIPDDLTPQDCEIMLAAVHALHGLVTTHLETPRAQRFAKILKLIWVDLGQDAGTL